MLDKFAVFITTHGRADNVKTYRTLRRCGYTGKIFLIVDNEDKSQGRYKEIYGNQVIIFDKSEAAKYTDIADNIPGRGAVVFARNACFDIAENLGLEWFVQMDDDYSRFDYRFDKDKKYRQVIIKNLDEVFSAFLEYFSSINADCIAFAQSGDFIGGGDGFYASSIWTKRKVMNSFFLSPSRRFDFLGRMNDDVNAYLSYGIRGRLMLTIFQVSLTQDETQKSKGGMTDIYKDSGTYQKSFYSIMYAPSCVKIDIVGSTYNRIHHRICWENAGPCIISDDLRKRSNTGQTPELITD